MGAILRSRITLVWFGLIAATALSWGIGHEPGHELGHGMGFASAREAGVAILVVAFVKVRFVILDFMEIRHAPRFMRLIAEVWVVVICAVLVTLFLTAPAGTAV